jgi:LacI family transcriptional regulator
MDLYGRRGSPINLKDVARLAGVHYSTASRALDPTKQGLVNARTAAHVQEVADRLGYRRHLLARSLRRGRTNTVGMIVPDLDNPIWSSVLHGVTSVLDDNGYLLNINETLDDHRRYRRILEHLAAWRVDAIISAATKLSDASLLEEIAMTGVPILLAIRTLPDHGFVGVSDDTRLAGTMAAEHLVGLGHRLLAELVGPLEVQPTRERSSAFVAEAVGQGAEVVEEKFAASNTTYEEGVRLMDELLESTRPRPTAVFAHNDHMAVGAIAAMRQRGLRCPQDISVMGLLDSPLVDRISPPLSTIRYPAMEVGALAGKTVLRLIEGAESLPAMATVPPRLVVRESTGPPPKD